MSASLIDFGCYLLADIEFNVVPLLSICAQKSTLQIIVFVLNGIKFVDVAQVKLM